MKTSELLGGRLLGAAVFVVLGYGGCSSGIPQDQIGDQLQAAFCRGYVRCGIMPDLAECLAATPSLLTPQMAADLETGKVSYDPVAGQKLVDAMDGISSCLQSERNPVSEEPVLSAWRAAFKGNVQVGGDCFVGEECASGFCQITDVPQLNNCAKGMCQALPPDPPLPTAGQSCDILAGCAPGFVCSFGDQPTCQVPPAEGAACAPLGGVECDDLRDICDSQTSTCQPAHAAGAACSPGGSDCGFTGWCDATSGTCRPLGRVGEPCTPDAAGGSHCLGKFVSCDAATNTCMLKFDEPPGCR